jgi:hypothetical protein
MASGEQRVDHVRTLWHYTTGQKLGLVLAGGRLQPAAADVPKAGRPVVWFSTNQEWEPTANLLWQGPDGAVERLTRDQTYVLGGGLARIGVRPEVAPHDWNAYKQLSGIAAKLAKQMYDGAIKIHARPGQWYASFDPVPRSAWLAVQILEGNIWVARAF